MVRSLSRGAIVLGMLTLFAAILTLAVPLSPAQAHAAYVSSTPEANTTVKTAPTQITINFAQPLDTKNLKITVYDDQGEVVSQGDAQITSPKTATIAMKGDDSDIYRVDWQNVSAQDGDPTLGAFVFAVDPSGSSDKIGPAESTTSSSSGTPAWVAVLTGVAGLVIGFIVANVMRGQRTQTTA